MTNTYINGCVRGLTQHLRQRCRKREVLLRSSWKHNGRGGTFICHHRDPTKSWEGSHEGARATRGTGQFRTTLDYMPTIMRLQGDLNPVQYQRERHLPQGELPASRHH